jgi:hypothetical protein
MVRFGVVTLSSSVPSYQSRSLLVGANALVLTFLLLLLLLDTGWSQGGTGIVPFSTRAGGSVDSVDLATSVVALNIPVRTKNGKAPLTYSLFGNTFMSMAFINAAWEWAPNYSFSGTYNIGRHRNPGYTTFHEPPLKNQTCGTHTDDAVQSGFVLHDSLGTQYPFPLNFKIDTYNCFNNPPQTIYIAAAGVTIVTAAFGDPWTFYDAEGNAYSGSPEVVPITDPDGTPLLQIAQGPPPGYALEYEDSLWSTG